MEHVFVADTNLFFECKKLEELAWSDLGVDPVVIALTGPVQAEIDKHKKGTGRTRNRAIEIFARIRQMLENNAQEIIIQAGSPRVVLRLVSAVRPDPELADALDYTTNDDRIVGILSALKKKGDAASVSLLTDDTGPASTASSLGLGFQLIFESWKRPPRTTDEAKEIEGLKKDLAAYRAQEPNIELRETNGQNNGQHIVRRLPVPLGESEIDKLVADLRSRHPMQTEHPVPEPELWADGTEVTYEAPDATSIEEYGEAYSGWLTRCRHFLTSLHEGREELEGPISLSIALRNSGTRPASRLRISFESLGNMGLLRGSEDLASENEEYEMAASAPGLALPKPPSPPMAKRHVKKPPTQGKGLDISSLNIPRQTAAMRAASNMSVPGSVIRDMRRSLGIIDHLDRMNAIGRSFDHMKAIPSALGYGPDLDAFRASVLGDTPATNKFWEHALDSGPRLIGPMTPPKHDPEGFYAFGWAPDTPVQSGGYTCDLFRHQHHDEVFVVVVLFPEDGDIQGAVRCRVQAENLTNPVELTIPVSRTIEEFELSDLAETLIAQV